MKRLLGGSVLAIVVGLVAGVTAAIGTSVFPSKADALATGYYCDQLVFSDTDCANMANEFGNPLYLNGYFNVQDAYVPGDTYNSGPSVCEHTYIYGTSNTASDRCEAGEVNSDGCNTGDLWAYYNDGIALSAHAGNNSSEIQTIEGHAFIESESGGDCV